MHYTVVRYYIEWCSTAQHKPGKHEIYPNRMTKHPEDQLFLQFNNYSCT